MWPNLARESVAREKRLVLLAASGYHFVEEHAQNRLSAAFSVAEFAAGEVLKRLPEFKTEGEVLYWVGMEAMERWEHEKHKARDIMDSGLVSKAQLGHAHDASVRFEPQTDGVALITSVFDDIYRRSQVGAGNPILPEPGELEFIESPDLFNGNDFLGQGVQTIAALLHDLRARKNLLRKAANPGYIGKLLEPFASESFSFDDWRTKAKENDMRGVALVARQRLNVVSRKMMLTEARLDLEEKVTACLDQVLALRKDVQIPRERFMAVAAMNNVIVAVAAINEAVHLEEVVEHILDRVPVAVSRVLPFVPAFFGAGGSCSICQSRCCRRLPKLPRAAFKDRVQDES